MVAAAVGEEDGEVEGGGVGVGLLEVDAESGCLAIELGEDPLLVDEAAVFAHAREVVAHLHIEHLGSFAALLEIDGLDVGRSCINSHNEVAKYAGVGLKPTSIFALDAAFHHAGGKGREAGAVKAADNLLLRLVAYEQGHADLVGVMWRIGAAPGLDGEDGREIAAVLLGAMEELVVVVDHVGGHLYLIIATADAEGPAHEEAVGCQMIGWMLGDFVHGHKAFKAVADIEDADGLVAVVVGDGHGDAVEGGVAIDEADAAVTKGAGGAYGVAFETAGDDIALLRGEVLVVVELGVDAASLGEGEAFHAVLEEGDAVNPDVDTVVAVAGRGAFGAVGSVDREVEAPNNGEWVIDGAEGHGIVGERELVRPFASVNATMAVDGQHTDAANGGSRVVAKFHTISEGVKDIKGTGVANLVVEMGATARTRVACKGHKVALMNGQHALGESGIEGIGLLFALNVIDIVGDSAIVAVEVEIDGSDAARMGYVEHLSAAIGRDTQADDIAVSRSVDGGAYSILAPNAKVYTAMEMVGTDLGKRARRSRHEMQGEV